VNDRPVFIGGLDRTGKTQLRILLETHAPIAFFRRADLWTHHRGRYGSLASDEAARRAVEGLLADRHVSALVSDPRALTRDLLAGPRTDARLFALIGRQWAMGRGLTRWGDQTALLEARATEILAAFPEGRIIHMIRDPRDRYAASARAGGTGRGGTGATMAAWLESVRAGETHAARWPERYLIVRFEDLVRDPAATVRRVLAFIGEEPGEAHGPIEVSPALAAGLGIQASLPSRVIALIEARCGSLMARHGYELTAPSLSMLERIGIAVVDRPLAAATAFARRGRSARAWRDRPGSEGVRP
jgi:hypothetical protein